MPDAAETSGSPTATSIPSPLRLPVGRLRLWGVGLSLMGLAPIVGAPFFGYHDWPAFWSAGAMAGSADLLTPSSQAAWQAGHGVSVVYFPYPPAAAFWFV